MHDYMVPMSPLCYVRPGCVLYVCVRHVTGSHMNQAINALQGMDRYRKEVIKVITYK